MENTAGREIIPTRSMALALSETVAPDYFECGLCLEAAANEEESGTRSHEHKTTRNEDGEEVVRTGLRELVFAVD
ncbi:Hypotetical protein [Gulosibacter molinativorax]|nr:Hypotetical protein [Gulosibacter molinativorax]